jgi:hypothetical protein
VTRMSDLERDLEALGSRLDYPREDIRVPVRGGIISARRRRRQIEQVVVASALLVAAFAPALIAGGSRAAILQFFGGRSSGQSENEATRQPTTKIRLPPGVPATLNTARTRLSFRVLLPRGLRPDGLYLGSQIAGDTITLIFHAQGLRLQLTEFRGRALSAPRGDLVSVDGTHGIWQTPTGHFSFTDSTGMRRDVAPTAAGNALLWQRGALTLQLQAVGLTRSMAVALARTVV